MIASTTHAVFVIRLKGPRHSSHNPLDSLRVSTPELGLRAQLNLTEKPKRSDHTWKACPEASTWFHVMLQTVELRTLLGKLEKEVLSWLPAMAYRQKRKAVPGTAASSSNHSTDVWNNEKMASSSLYLDELLIQKCKFRHRFTVNF